MQYYLQKEVFGTSLKGYADFSDPKFKNISLEILEYVRTGLLIKAESSEFNATLLFIPRLKYRVVTFNVNDTRYQLVYKKVVECTGNCFVANELGKDIDDK